jgi:hypothetical protein
MSPGLHNPRSCPSDEAWTPMRPIHFFRVVSLHSPYLLLGLAVVGILGIVTVALDHTKATHALTPVLLLQMFAVSSGFQVPARRGHFDLLLSGGSTRIRIAVTHWALSALPGCAVWIVVGVAELVVSEGLHARAFLSGSAAALLLVSAVAWALTVPLPRLSGGVVWVVTMVVAVTMTTGWRDALVAAARGDGTWVSRPFLFLLFPFSLIGTRIELVDVPSLATVLVGALTLWAGAVWWIVRTDIPLEASQ